MSSKKEEKKEKPADDMIFEDRVQHYKGLAYAFTRDLIANTNRESAYAHFVCYNFEHDTLGHEALSATFPKRKRDFKNKAKKISKTRSPLEKQKKALRAEVAVLEKADAEAGGGKPSKKLATLYKNLADIDRQLSEVKPAKEYPRQYRLADDRDKTALVAKEDWAYLGDWFGREAEKFLKRPPNPVYTHMCELTGYLKMEKAEADLVTLLLCYEKVGSFKTLVDKLAMNKEKGYNAVFGKMLGVDSAKVASMLKEDSPLAMVGIISSMHGDDAPIVPRLNGFILDNMAHENVTLDDITKKMIGDPVTTDLDWDRDFSHLGAAGEQALKILQGGAEARATGLNILFYGLQDTGKTEAVKALCKKAGITLYAVGEDDDLTKGEMSRADRMSSALMAQCLLKDQPKAALLFDEMEDALPRPGAAEMHDDMDGPSIGAGKVFLNRMLEKNQTITFWTANNPEEFHPAVRRRMGFSVEFKVPPPKVRERMWESISAKQEFTLASDDGRRLARAYKAPPGMITTAVRNAKLTGDGVAALETSLRASAELVFGSRGAIEIRQQMPEKYDLGLLNATVEDSHFDMHTLTQDIAASSARDVSILLYGHPGTGKSAFAVHFAEALGMEILSKKGSDIFDKYVGETEKKMAAMFAEAREGKMLLVLNEADSLLQDRRKVEYSWQIPMINEMLTQVEEHPLPVIFTTNLVENLDEASKRRFVFKLRCDYLKPEQAVKAFELFFNQPAPEAVKTMDMLTPGDFSNVLRQARFTREPLTAEQLVSRLKREIGEKSEKKARPLGFASSRLEVAQAVPGKR